ncbi:hypothetical protein [Marimonas lutisalis]|uniref:hypothetical protein n=1 Tax=Marimonas lutisalis TaxID=2545756 RepID=UPI0010F58735|nr:hypothetical protein [Marimonas lutisalis]
MKKLTKNKSSKAENLRAETVIDRSTRVSKQILQDEAEQRELKTERLRKARLEKESGFSGKEPKATSKGMHGKS